LTQQSNFSNSTKLILPPELLPTSAKILSPPSISNPMLSSSVIQSPTLQTPVTSEIYSVSKKTKKKKN